jgi:hypothetical protein
LVSTKFSFFYNFGNEAVRWHIKSDTRHANVSSSVSRRRLLA